MIIMLGKANPNHEAKLMTSPLSGNNLREINESVQFLETKWYRSVYSVLTGSSDPSVLG